MAALTDPDRLRAYQDALSNWRFQGFIQFRLPEASYRWIRRELDGVSLNEIKRLMHEFVASGGEIDEVRERREEYSREYEFHHDLRFTVEGKPVYVETVLKYRLPVLPDDSSILVVNIHGS